MHIQRRAPWFWSSMELVSYWMAASFLFWLCALPVVTLPLGVALAMRLLARQRDRSGDILPTWRQEFARLWRPALGAGWLMVIGILVLYGDLWAIGNIDAPALKYMSIPLLPVGVAVLALEVGFWTSLAVAPAGSREMLNQAARFAMRHPIRCLLGALVGLLAFVLLSILPGMFLLLGPGVLAAIWLRFALGPVADPSADPK